MANVTEEQAKAIIADSASLGVIRENLALVERKSASAETVRREYYKQAAEIFLWGEKGGKNKAGSGFDERKPRETARKITTFDKINENPEDNTKAKSAHAALLYEQLLGKCDSLITTDYAGFCLEYAKAARLKNNRSIQVKEETIDKIAYMQNTYSDRAYRVLSPSGKTAAVYFPGFREACEEVYYERCSHTLLPIYSSADGVLLSFYKLLLKYDLRIVRSCTVSAGDEEYMKYALAAKYLTESGTSGPETVDLSVVLSEGEKYGAFISACEVFGASVATVNSITLDYTDEGCGILLQLDTRQADIEALRLFLDSSRVRCSIIGQYDTVKSKKR